MLVALDEGPGPAIKYQYAELGRLYQVVSQLIRSCDVSQKQQSSQPVSINMLLKDRIDGIIKVIVAPKLELFRAVA